MRYRRTTRDIVIVALAVILVLAVNNLSSQRFIDIQMAGSPEDLSNIPDLMDPQDEVILEATPVFVTSSAGDDYVDSFEFLTYGSHTNLPPSGMGEDNSLDTEMTETSAVWTDMLTQTAFYGRPSGWSDSNIQYLSGDFNSDGSTLGYLYCKNVNTTEYTNVKFTLSIGIQDFAGQISVKVYFYDFLSNWNEIGTYPEGAKQDYAFSSSSGLYMHSNFKVRVGYTASGDCYFGADNWRIQGQLLSDNCLFQAVYKFTGVDFDTYRSERLYVDFSYGEPSGEYLDFRFEADDITPDYLVGNHKRSDFNVDIHPYLNGSECYVEIRDEYRWGDEDIDTWKIDRMYIRLTNAVPQNDQAPSCANLDDSDNLYAGLKYYQITTSHQDIDGYSHIDFIDLECWNDGRTTRYWSLRYDEDTDSFSEQADSNNSVTLDAESSSASRSGYDLNATFRIIVNWTHPDTSDIDLCCLVYDADAAYDTDYYETDWDIETRLDVSSFGLDDSSGTPDRGSINNDILASGTLVYFGSSLHPSTDLVDVYVSCSDVSTSPWEATNYEASGGSFSVTVQADDIVGLDTYTFKAVVEGTGSDGDDLLHSAHSNTYIADQIRCVSLSSPSFIIDSADTGQMDVQVQYAYNGDAVTDGIYRLGSEWMVHQSGDLWQATYAANELTSINYDTISVMAANEHGVLSVDMNDQNLTMYWEQLVCYIDGPTPNVINIGENASGIHVWAEYYFWESHGYRYYDGTLNLNDTTFVYGTIGTRGYAVSSADGNDTWGVFTISSAESTSCTWVYPDPPPSWEEEPQDQVIEFGFSFSYSLLATVPSGVDTWWLNDTLHFIISDTEVVENSTNLPVGIYGLQVWVNDTYGRELTGIFTVTVGESTAPTWGEQPENQMFEFGQPFSYVLSAEVPMGLDTLWLNDTIHFAIDELGVVTNSTNLPVGIYGLQVWLNDTWGRELTGVFAVTVQDTTEPNWVETPSNQIFEYGAVLDVQLAAWDLSGVSHWAINDTVNFIITNTGRLLNLSISGPGTFGLIITAYDVFDNPLSITVTITAMAPAPPTWVIEPVNQTVEFGDAFHCDLDAEDYSGIDDWWLDDTAHFAIDLNGTITNSTSLPVSAYYVEVRVSDMLGNIRGSMFIVTVQDTVLPTWVTAPTDQDLHYEESLGLQLEAWDLSSISQWTVNDTVRFAINDTGYLTSIVTLEPGTHVLNVTVYDAHGNTRSATFEVTVAPSTSFMGLPPGWFVLIIIGSGGIIIVVIFIVRARVLTGKGM